MNSVVSRAQHCIAIEPCWLALSVSANVVQISLYHSFKGAARGVFQLYHGKTGFPVEYLDIPREILWNIRYSTGSHMTPTGQKKTIEMIYLPERMKHLRCRCLGGMTHYPQTQLSTIPQTQQLQMHVYRISVQQSQCSALVMQSEANQC